VATILAATAAGTPASQLPTARTGDRVGDSNGAPDICEVSIWRNASAVGFRITFADRPALEPGERVSIVLDSDPGKATGNPSMSGADLLLSWGIVGERIFAGELVSWNGARWELVPGDKGKAKFRIGKGVLEVLLDRSLLRGRGFRWIAVTFQAQTGRGTDLAPDEGMASFAHPGGGPAPKRTCTSSRPT
jgi:hypothetical protein